MFSTCYAIHSWPHFQKFTSWLVRRHPSFSDMETPRVLSASVHLLDYWQTIPLSKSSSYTSVVIYTFTKDYFFTPRIRKSISFHCSWKHHCGLKRMLRFSAWSLLSSRTGTAKGVCEIIRLDRNTFSQFKLCPVSIKAFTWADAMCCQQACSQSPRPRSTGPVLTAALYS